MNHTNNLISFILVLLNLKFLFSQTLVNRDSLVISNCFESSIVSGCLNIDCKKKVCKIDNYCCIMSWDQLCVRNANYYCNKANKNLTRNDLTPIMNEIVYNNSNNNSNNNNNNSNNNIVLINNTSKSNELTIDNLLNDTKINEIKMINPLNLTDNINMTEILNNTLDNNINDQKINKTKDLNKNNSNINFINILFSLQFFLLLYIV